MRSTLLTKGIRTDNKQPIIGNACELPDGTLMIKNFKSVWVDVIPESVGLFSGKTDNDGQPIFQHDRIKTPAGLWRVVYNDCAFTAEPVNHDATPVLLRALTDITFAANWSPDRQV